MKRLFYPTIALVAALYCLPAVAQISFNYEGVSYSVSQPGYVTATGPDGATTGSLSIPSIVYHVHQVWDNDRNEYVEKRDRYVVRAVAPRAFYNQRSYTGTLTLGDSIQTIGDNAFWYCNGFTGSLKLPSKLKTIGAAAFYQCSKFQGALTVGSELTSVGKQAFAAFGAGNYGEGSFEGVHISSLSAWCNIDFADDSSNPLYYGHRLVVNGVEMTTFRLPAGRTTIKPYTFTGINLEGTLTIPEGVTSIGEGAFEYMQGATALSLPSTLKTIGASAFYGTALTEVKLPLSVKEVKSRAFSRCDKLQSVTVPDGCAARLDSCFTDCRALTAVSLGNMVSDINEAFSECPVTSMSVSENNRTFAVSGSCLCSKDLTKLYYYFGGDTHTAFKITQMFASPWVPTADLRLDIDGQSLQRIYDNFVAQVGGIGRHRKGSMEEIVALRQRIGKETKELEQLEKRMRREQQVDIQMRMHTEARSKREVIKELKQKLEEMGA